MANFCLTKEAVDNFKKGLKDRAIDPVKLSLMESNARRDLLAEFVGKDNAPQVNALFESKTLLKNQKAGYINWAKKVGGLKPEVRRDLVTKIEKLDKVLNPTEEKAFLQDLANTKLGIDVTLPEAQKISELSQKIGQLKDFTNEKERIAYGNAILDLHDYTQELSKTNMGLVGNIVNIANVPRNLMSSVDFSAPLRQGFGSISHPVEFAKAFGSMFKYAFSEKSYRNLMADITTRDTYELMKSSGLRITKLDEKLSQREEAFMSSLTDKIPGMAQSERAYTGFLNKLRADIFDKMIKVAEGNGESVAKGSKSANDIAQVVNDFTGSGNLGEHDKYAGAVPALNTIFFSPRKIAATVNIFNPVNYAKLSPTARGLAIRNLIGMVGVSATVLTLAKLNGATVETDSNSSDFGKVVLGNTRFDATGGNGNYLVLLSRLLSGKTKSSINDITKELKGGIGGQTRADVFTKYVRNKLSPIASFVADWLYGTDSTGSPFDLGNEAKSRVMPLVIQDTIDTIQNDPSHALLGAFLDTFGVGVQTYGATTNWKQSGGSKIQQFQKSVGDAKSQQANNEYNTQYETFRQKVLTNPTYQHLSDTQKQAVLTKAKSTLQNKIFKEYNFKYKQQKTSAQDKATIKQLSQ